MPSKRTKEAAEATIVNPFHEHNIEYISPSSVGAWLTDRSYWVAKYVWKIESNVGPAAWRGTAVEHGLETKYFAPQYSPTAKMYQQFENEAQGLATPEAEAERRNLQPMLEQAFKAFDTIPYNPISTQNQHHYNVSGLMVPLMGYSDFMFDKFAVDLKTTMRCPSKPKPNHAMQVSFYAKAAGHKKAFLCYVTPKKYEIYPLNEDDIEANFDEFVKHAMAIQTSLLVAKTGADVLDIPAKNILARMNCGDFSSFYWDEDTIAKAKEQIEDWK